MTTPIERAAKAIQAHGSVRYGVGWEAIPGDAKEMFRQDARAALASLSPTQAMIDAGLKAAGRGPGHEAEISSMDLEDAFNAMILEALK